MRKVHIIIIFKHAITKVQGKVSLDLHELEYIILSNLDIKHSSLDMDFVGTLKLGYPLLLYKDTLPTRLSLSRVVKVLCVGPSHDSP
jgi:hypothetical protein